MQTWTMLGAIGGLLAAIFGAVNTVMTIRNGRRGLRVDWDLGPRESDLCRLKHVGSVAARDVQISWFVDDDDAGVDETMFPPRSLDVVRPGQLIHLDCVLMLGSTEPQLRVTWARRWPWRRGCFESELPVETTAPRP